MLLFANWQTAADVLKDRNVLICRDMGYSVWTASSSYSSVISPFSAMLSSPLRHIYGLVRIAELSDIKSSYSSVIYPFSDMLWSPLRHIYGLVRIAELSDIKSSYSSVIYPFSAMLWSPLRHIYGLVRIAELSDIKSSYSSVISPFSAMLWSPLRHIYGLVRITDEACFSLLHGYHSNPATPILQDTSKQEHTINLVTQ